METATYRYISSLGMSTTESERQILEEVGMRCLGELEVKAEKSDCIKESQREQASE